MKLDKDGWEVSGLTDNYLRINSVVSRNMLNTLSPVRIISVDKGGIKGSVIA